MLGQRFAGFFTRFDPRVTELFALDMGAHGVDQALPELFTALFVDRFIADDRELVRPRGHEDQNGIVLVGPVHTEFVKSLGRGDQRIGIQLSALNINANLTGRFRFGVPNRCNDTIVLELSEKFLRAHDVTSYRSSHLRRNSRRHR
jgi:hypothetical protein